MNKNIFNAVKAQEQIFEGKYDKFISAIKEELLMSEDEEHQKIGEAIATLFNGIILQDKEILIIFASLITLFPESSLEAFSKVEKWVETYSPKNQARKAKLS